MVSAAAKIVFELKRQQKRRIEVGAAVLAVNVSLYRKLPFDPVKDFVNVSLTVATPNILAVHPTVPAKSVRALIQLARAKPGGLNYASARNGTTSHLAAELFKTMADVNIVHIPYKGTSPAVVALLSGEVAIMLASALTLLSHIKGNRVRGLAVSGTKRSPAIPELPTYVARAFKTKPAAWKFFQTLSARNRRDFVVWIHLAKRPETREKRIRESIELLSAGKKLGLK